MKFIVVLAVLFLAVASFARADGSQRILDLVKSKHLKRLIEGQVKIRDRLNRLGEACPGSEEKLDSAITQLKRCHDEAVESGLTICEAVDTVFALNCSSPMISLIEECVPSQMRELAALGTKSLVSVMQYLCGLQGESFIELTNQCLFEHPPVTEQLQECENKIHELAGNFTKKTPSPSELCGHTEFLKKCLQAHLNLSCKSAKTRTSFIGLLDAINAPCSAINEI